MKKLLQYFIILIFSVSISSAQTITVVGMSFSPDTLTITLGDTVEFGSLGYHNAVEVDQSTWIANDTTYNGGFYFPFGSPGGYFVPDSAKTYYYVCQPHASMAMKGVIVVNPVQIPGCMDSTAINYDPLATIDDGSCIYPLPPAENLFFSEYAEGSSNNKYFEIYNPTNDTVDLTNYAFAMVNNSPVNIGVYEYWVDFDSAAVILPHDVYVVAHSSADSLIIAAADMDYYVVSQGLSNGDDGLALVYGAEPSSPVPPSSGGYVVLDWLGDWNGDPGQGWDVAGINNATRNHTLIRKCNITSGDTSWVNSAGTNQLNSQWIVKPNNYWNNLGIHTFQTASYDSVSFTICNGLSITIGNNTYDSTGVYSDTLLSYNGCDSIITTTLTVLSSSASVVTNNHTICDGDSIVVGSNAYNVTGVYIDTLANSVGCDSIITTNLTVQTPNNLVVTICDGDSIVVGNNVYSTTGNYTDTLLSSIGCDSIVNTNLTIYSQFNSIYGGIPNNSIGGGGFYSGSQYLEMSCYMPSELVSAVVYAEDTVSETFEIRDNNGNVLSDTLVTVIPGGHRIYFNYNMNSGIDYQLGVSGNSNDLYRNNSGVNYPYNFGSLASITSSSAGGSYYYFFYDIEVRPSSQPMNYSICDGDSIQVAGSVYNATGLYIDSLISTQGCDSLVYTNLVVYPNISYINNQTICNGEVYVIGSNIYDSSGTYFDTLSTSYGCDSLVTTNLTVLTITGGTSVNPQTICLGDSISVGTSTYYNDGVYSDTLLSSNGCDSVVSTILTTLTANYLTYNFGLLDSSIVPGAFSNYNGHLILDASVSSIIKSATVYSQDTNSVIFELRDNNGVVLDNVTHTVYPGSQSLTFNFNLPAGNDFQLGVDASGGNIGLFRSNAGSGNTVPYPFDIGAVSITSSNAGNQYYYYYYDIEIMPYAHYEDIYICDGDSILIAGNIYNSPTSIVDTFLSSNLCDSVLYVELDFYQSPNLLISSSPDPPEICLGETIILEASSGFISYAWTTGEITQTIDDTPTQDTWYMVEATDSNGCTLREDITVYIDSCPSWNCEPNNFFSCVDPGDGTGTYSTLAACQAACVTSINELDLKNINIFPNPTDGMLNINFITKGKENVRIILVNEIGEEILQEDLNNFNGEYTKSFDLSGYAKGIYFIKISTEKESVHKKVILY